MRIPDSLVSLIDCGVVEEVVRPLMSGKEAQVYLVQAGGIERVAKVYKEAHSRTFRHRADYTEGRNLRNSRDRRAIGKRSRHGRAKDEEAWRSAEVEVIYKLRHAGVRVPEPYNFMDGVLVMELVTNGRGRPAPRLADVALERDEAQEVYDQLLREVVKMLCAGVVHGDLSDFNVLLGEDGPVIIDFPQAVDPASNRSARRLLLRDVQNLHDFLGRCGVRERPRPYGQEMWELYERSELTPQTQLSGRFRQARGKTNTANVLSLIDDAEKAERRRQAALGMKVVSPSSSPKSSRVVEVVMNPPPQDRGRRSRGSKTNSGRAGSNAPSGSRPKNSGKPHGGRPPSSGQGSGRDARSDNDGGSRRSDGGRRRRRRRGPR